MPKPEVFEEHVDDFLKNHPEPKNDRELWWRMYVGSEIAEQRLMRGSLTSRQQLEIERKNILTDNQKYYQSVANRIAERKEFVKKDAGREKWAKQKNRFQLVIDGYKYDRMDRELRLAQQQAVLEAFRPLWVHLGILPEDEVHKKDETLNNGALLQMADDAHDNAERRQQAIWDGQSQELKTWKAGQERIEVRVATLTEEELDRWVDIKVWSMTEAERIALDDAKFALWRASVNEGSSPPAQNPGGGEGTTSRGNLGDDGTTE